MGSQVDWKRHIVQTKLNIASSVGVLKRIRNRMDNKTSCLLYDAKILSCI